jgi:hypothetical protein
MVAPLCRTKPQGGAADRETTLDVYSYCPQMGERCMECHTAKAADFTVGLCHE